MIVYEIKSRAVFTIDFGLHRSHLRCCCVCADVASVPTSPVDRGATPPFFGTRCESRISIRHATHIPQQFVTADSAAATTASVCTAHFTAAAAGRRTTSRVSCRSHPSSARRQSDSTSQHRPTCDANRCRYPPSTPRSINLFTHPASSMCVLSAFGARSVRVFRPPN